MTRCSLPSTFSDNGWPIRPVGRFPDHEAVSLSIELSHCGRTGSSNGRRRFLSRTEAEAVHVEIADSSGHVERSLEVPSVSLELVNDISRDGWRQAIEEASSAI